LTTQRGGTTGRGGRRGVNSDIRGLIASRQRRLFEQQGREIASQILASAQAGELSPLNVPFVEIDPVVPPAEPPPAQAQGFLPRMLGLPGISHLLGGLGYATEAVMETVARPIGGVGVTLGRIPSGTADLRALVDPERAREVFREADLPSGMLRVAPDIDLPASIFGPDRTLGHVQLGVKGAVEIFPELALTGGLGSASVKALRIPAKEAAVKAATVPTQIVKIPPTQTFMDAAFGNRGAVATLVGKIPGAERVIGSLNRATFADNILDQTIVIRGQMEDMAEGAVFIATKKARMLRQQGKFGFEQQVLPAMDGRVTDPAIIQIRNLPDGAKSLAVHDVVEFMARYKMPLATREFVKEVRKTSKGLTDYLMSEGVDIPKLRGESDWRYLHRIVVSVKQDAVRGLATNAETLFKTAGSPVIRGVQESPWEYMQRVMDGVTNGTIAAPNGLDDIARQVNDLFDVSIRKQSLVRRRSFSLAADGLRAGTQYSDDVFEELMSQADMAYRMVINKRAGEMLRPLSRTADELIEADKPGLLGLRGMAETRATKAVKLLSVVRRANRAESVPGATLKMLAGHFPELVDELRNAMAILPEDISVILRRKEFLKELGITDKKFRDVLEAVRPAARRQAPVGVQELRDTLAVLRADTITAERMLREIYENAKLHSRTQRKGAFNDLVARTELMKSTVSKESTALKNQLATVRRAVTESPELGSVIGVPGVASRIIPTQVIRGKTVFGRDIATEIRAMFGYMPNTWTTNRMKELTFIANTYRLGKASFDMGIQGIQLMAVLGIDFANAILAPATKILNAAGLPVQVQPLTAIFPKAAASSYWTFFNPRHELNYWLKAENHAALVERVKRGSLVQPSEFTAGAADIQRIAERIPQLIVPWPLNIPTLIKQTIGRSDAAWSAGRNVAGNELWKAYKGLMRGNRELDDLAKFTNIATGTFSLRGIGTSAGKRNALGAIGFFSPRYTAAQLALVGRILRGGVGRRLALQSVLGMISANTLTTVMMATALGQKPAINPLPRSMGGDGSDLWTVKVGNRRMGVGGPGYSILRMIASTTAETADEPDRLTNFDRSNPLIRAYLGRSAGPTRIVTDYIAGRDFIGEPVRGMGSLKPSKETLEWLKTLPVPIWAEEIIKDDESGVLGAVVVEWFGGRTFPTSFWSRYRDLLEETDMQGRNFDDISRIDQVRMKAEYPELEEAWQAATDDAARRGWNPLMTEYFERLDAGKQTYWRQVEAGYEQVLTNPTFSMRDFKSAVIKAGSNRLDGIRQELETNPRYDSVLQDLEDREDEFVEDAVYRDIWRTWFDPTIYDDAGVPDYDERNKRLFGLRDRILEEHGEEPWDKAMEHWAVERLKSPKILQEYHSMIEIMRPYWETYKAILGDDPERVRQYAIFKGLTGDRQREIAAALPWVAEVSALSEVARQQMRATNQEIDAMAYRWDVVDSLLHPDNQGTEDELRAWEAGSFSELSIR